MSHSKTTLASFGIIEIPYTGAKKGDQGWMQPFRISITSVDNPSAWDIINRYSVHIDTRKIESLHNTFVNMTRENTKVRFIPLIHINQDDPSKYEYKNIRGDKDDTNPFILRGKKICKVVFDYNGRNIWVRNENYSDVLTEGEQSFLNRMFGEKLMEAYTEEIFSCLKSALYIRIWNKIHGDTQEILEKCTELKRISVNEGKSGNKAMAESMKNIARAYREYEHDTTED